jgi:hypothetical protein
VKGTLIIFALAVTTALVCSHFEILDLDHRINQVRKILVHALEIQRVQR